MSKCPSFLPGFPIYDHTRIYNDTNQDITELVARPDDIYGYAPTGYILKAGNLIKTSYIKGTTLRFDSKTFVAGNYTVPFLPGDNSVSIGKNSKALGNDCFSLGNESSVTGNRSYAIGYQVNVSGFNSYALGELNECNGDNNFLLGANGIINGSNSYTLGFNSINNGNNNFAAGTNNNINGNLIISLGAGNNITGSFNRSIGSNVNISGASNTSIGNNNTHIGNGSFTFGNNNRINGNNSYIIGNVNNVTGNNNYTIGVNSQIEGNLNNSMGSNCRVAGQSCIAIGSNSFSSSEAVCLGRNTTATGISAYSIGSSASATGNSSYAIGRGANANGLNSYAIGQNVRSNENNTFVFGNNGSNNPFPSDGTGTFGTNGQPNIQLVRPVGTSVWITSNVSNNGFIYCNGGNSRISANKVESRGADYAELFEWETPQNEPYGYFVKVTGEKITLSDSSENVIGITSKTAGVIGDIDEDYWKGRYEKDFLNGLITQLSYIQPIRNYLMNKGYSLPLEKISHTLVNLSKNETIQHYSELIDITEEDILEIENIEAEETLIEADEYNPEIHYIRRRNRGWTEVGLIGKIAVRDNGNCIVGNYCDCLNGVAVPGTHWKILSRISENSIRILYK